MAIGKINRKYISELKQVIRDAKPPGEAFSKIPRSFLLDRLEGLTANATMGQKSQAEIDALKTSLGIKFFKSRFDTGTTTPMGIPLQRRPKKAKAPKLPAGQNLTKPKTPMQVDADVHYIFGNRQRRENAVKNRSDFNPLEILVDELWERHKELEILPEKIKIPNSHQIWKVPPNKLRRLLNGMRVRIGLRKKKFGTPSYKAPITRSAFEHWFHSKFSQAANEIATKNNGKLVNYANTKPRSAKI